VVLVLGVVYTIKVLDIILGLTGGGPANATQTHRDPVVPAVVRRVQLRQGAALSNILIAISLVFAIFYLRATGARSTSEGADMSDRPACDVRRVHRHRVADPGRDAVPGLLDAQRLAAAVRQHRGDPWLPVAPDASTATPPRSASRGNLVTSLIIALGTVVLSLLIATPARTRWRSSGPLGVVGSCSAILISQMIPGS
jgi:hypothetical protein